MATILALALPLSPVHGNDVPVGVDPVEDAGSFARLVAAAQREGSLNVVALPRDWCNYGAVIDGFKEKYGLEVNELNPDGSSAAALQAIIDNKGSSGPEAPDVIDVGPSFAETAKELGLLRPYRVRAWRTIPAEAADTAGYWYAAYYGLLAVEANVNVAAAVPTDWADLLDPRFEAQIALGGDPRVSQQGLHAVYVAALVNGGSLDDAAPGLDFWRQVNEEGNLLSSFANAARIDSGATPIAIRWTFNAMAHHDATAGNPPIAVVVPPTARIAGMYSQAISAYAPHPNAARLWMEYLFGDEGQRHFVNGYCHPTRLADLVDRGAIPAEELDRLPPADGALFPTIAQIRAAAEVITAGWGPVVGVDID